MAGNKFDIDVGKRLMSLRRERGQQQKDVMSAVGVNNRETINQWESGDRKIKAEHLAMLAKHFDVSADYLLGLSPDPTRDVDEQNACAYTGLSVKAIRDLHQINTYPHGELGTIAKGYVVGTIDLLSDMIESKRFHSVFSEIAFYLIFGGALPEEAYRGKVVDINSEEWEKFHEWANNRGLEVVPRKDVCEMHLQKACDELKAMWREILDSELLKRKSGDING